MYHGGMRTTVTLDRDVAAAVEHVRRQEGVGLSEALNSLVRRGLGVRATSSWMPPAPVEVELRIDVSDVSEALELLDGPDYRS